MNIIWSNFIVRQTTEDSFIIGIAVTKKWGGAQKTESLQEFEKWGGGLKPSSLIEVYAYVSAYVAYLLYCRWRMYLARWYARAWSSSCSQAVALNATRLFLYAARQLYRYMAVCSFGRQRGLIMLLDLFLVRFSLIFLFVPCGEPSWLHVTFYCTLNKDTYTVSYRIICR